MVGKLVKNISEYSLAVNDPGVFVFRTRVGGLQKRKRRVCEQDVILRALLFLSGNHYHTRLYFLQCRDGPRLFNFHFTFCASVEKDFGEYVDLGIYTF